MENSNYPQIYPGAQYFPPPSAWIDPDSVSPDDDNTPTWVIVGAVTAAVILFGFLFYYIWRREKKIREKAASRSVTTQPTSKPATESQKQDKTKTEDKTTKPPDTQEKNTPSKDTGGTTKKDTAPTAKPPTIAIPISYPGQIVYPGHCPACGHGGGLYSFSYTCPQCKYKVEYNVAYPPKK